MEPAAVLLRIVRAIYKHRTLVVLECQIHVFSTVPAKPVALYFSHRAVRRGSKQASTAEIEKLGPAAGIDTIRNHERTSTASSYLFSGEIPVIQITDLCLRIHTTKSQKNNHSYS
jgi:hypothetical protein